MVSGRLSMADVRSLEAGTAVRVRERLPGINPSHFCTRCPTFFRRRDRFYLTSLREDAVHGISVWPHHGSRLRVELGPDGLVTMFADGSTVMVPDDGIAHIVDDHFRGHGKNEVVEWSTRRGFDVQLVPKGDDYVNLDVAPSGPHFPLLVVKSWMRDRRVRVREDLLAELETADVAPIHFPPADLHA